MSISAVGTAFMGIQRNFAMFDSAANRLAMQSFDAESIRDVRDMKLAKHGVAANAAVLRVADEMTSEVINLLV